MVPRVGDVVPLGSERDLERAVLGPGVDGGQIEGQAVEPPPLDRRIGRLEVAVPRLVGGAGEGDVEADLDDSIVLGQHRLADGDEPRMGGDFDETAEALGLGFDIPALGQRSALDPLRFLEQSHHVLIEIVGELAAEGSLQRDDPVAVEAAHDRGLVKLVDH